MPPMFGQMITDMAPGIKKANGCIITTFTGFSVFRNRNTKVVVSLSRMILTRLTIPTLV